MNGAHRQMMILRHGQQRHRGEPVDPRQTHACENPVDDAEDGIEHGGLPAGVLRPRASRGTR